MDTKPLTDSAVDDMTTATRYLCAGTHLDEGFARAVIREIEEEHHRAPAPNHGVNIMVVHEHARRAVQRLTQRNHRLALCLAVSLVLQPAATLVFWPIAAMAGGDGVRSLDPRSSRIAAGTGDRPGSARRRVILGAVTRAVVMLVAAWIVTGVVQILPTPLVYLPGQTLDVLLLVVALVVAPWLVCWQERTEAWQTVSRELTAEGFAAKHPRTADGAPLTDGNITVYSGYSPFVGTGIERQTWSLTMHLTPARGLTGTIPAQAQAQRGPWTVPIDADDLVEGLAERLSALGAGAPGAAAGIANLEVTEKLFVNGTELPQPWVRDSGLTAAVLPDEERPPVTEVPEQLVHAHRGRDHGPVRHCLRVEVTAWGADLVLSLFVQVVLSGGLLSLSTTTLLLPPVRAGYRVADSVLERGARGGPATTDSGAPAGGGDDTEPVIAAQSLKAGLKDLAAAPAAVYRELREPGRRARRNADLLRAIAEDRTFDYGARLSLRELAADSLYRNYFQRADVTRISQQLDMRLVDYLAQILEANGLDTTELDDSRTQLLNAGVIITGGSMSGTIVAGQRNTVSTPSAQRG
ncbi:hypothetical protein [Streptacidiphilus melanogenes]|uniref:hypothetical protein n=1 Tax=Streptacidiphilus melanogenes TaxID=411235 RepID=UPI0005A681EE|nr:hypothetical protein [Streptacidiphilus melanogenes]